MGFNDRIIIARVIIPGDLYLSLLSFVCTYTTFSFSKSARGCYAFINLVLMTRARRPGRDTLRGTL